MRTQKNILIAFLLNITFSVFELFGGIFTGSVAIISDSVHDLGDAVSIGFSYFLERKSRKQPDSKYTYGYLRFSVLGGIITTFILLFGSLAVIYNAVLRILNPVEINYNGMIIFAIIGAVVNFGAAYFTREGDSINQKAVNLHMLEDMLGWFVVLIGAIVMKFTEFKLLDPILSIAVAVFILVNAIKNLKEVLDLFLEKTPDNVNINEIVEHIEKIDGVLNVHHIHIRSIDGHSNYATMHIVTNSDHHKIKDKVRNELEEHGIGHATLELETPDEHCHHHECYIEHNENHSHHHHHHHH
ncbi:MAG: cation transporter [Ruminococcaceae bacterium]|nr:cation transporter [Oscillospiraceae bacterium]